MEDAKNGINNLILAAYSTRNDAKVLSRPMTNDDGEVVFRRNDDDDDGVAMDDFDDLPPRLIVDCPPTLSNTVTPPPPPQPTNKNPSDFLSSQPFLQLANSSIKGTFNIEIESVISEIKEHANKLSQILSRRLSMHIRSKI